eukprot:1142477-Pelagomonas_calceolata.AAC.7
MLSGLLRILPSPKEVILVKLAWVFGIFKKSGLKSKELSIPHTESHLISPDTEDLVVLVPGVKCSKKALILSSAHGLCFPPKGG